MNPFEMVVLIIAIVTVGRILQSRYRSQGRIGLIDAPADSSDSRRLQDEVRALKERIAVLERLATDDNNTARLDREIEKLRDKI